MTFFYNNNFFSNDILRLIDANFNRAREGIRVIEETSRMLFDDSVLTKRIKNIRHSLSELRKKEKGLNTSMLFARGSEKDVLRDGETESEKSRSGLESIVRANAARAEEALRALEEYTKLSMPHLSGKCKEIRFNIYDIEKALVSSIHVNEVTGGERMKFSVVINYPEIRKNVNSKDIAEITKEILDAGAGTVIYRDKISKDSDFLKNADKMLAVCNDRDVTVLFENRLDIAMICGANGIIIDTEDIPAQSCRKICGQSFAIGVSTDSENMVPGIINPDVDFYVFGNFTLNENYRLGKLEKLREFVSISNVPVLVSAGIPENEISDLFENGVHGVVLTPNYTHSENLFIELMNYRNTIDSCIANT